MQISLKHNISEKFSWQAKGLSTIDFEKATLCLEICADSLHFAIFSAEKEVLVIKSLQNNQFNLQLNSLDSFYHKEELLHHTFYKVFISIQNQPYTLIPKAFYKEEDRDMFLKFNCGSKKNYSVLVDDLNRMDAKLVYGIDTDLKKSIDKLFPNHHTKSGVSVMIDSSYSEKSAKESAFLNFRKDAIDLILCKPSPIFCNSFAVLSPEDLLYFVLASLEQNGLNPQSVKLLITGETETNALAIKLLKKYLKHISFAIIDKQFKKPLDIVGMPAHYYYHLLNRIHCE